MDTSHTFDSWHSYPSIYNLGHKAVQQLLTVPHYIEEKVDGSQFSFGLFDVEGVAEWKVRSKGCDIYIDAPPKMFKQACDTVKELGPALHVGWTYRGEVLTKPKHNVLVYDRAPKGGIILFDVNTGNEEWLSPADKHAEAERLGLECVAVLRSSQGETTYDDIRELLETKSALGGALIEGVVVKQLGPDYLYGRDKKTLIGKFVSEAFKEIHVGEWKKSNPSGTDFIASVLKGVATPARWHKAVVHLRERGELTDSPRDIGKLIQEAQADLEKEEEDTLKEALWGHFKKEILRGSIRGLPEWYKDQLLQQQFDVPAAA